VLCGAKDFLEGKIGFGVDEDHGAAGATYQQLYQASAIAGVGGAIAIWVH